MDTQDLSIAEMGRMLRAGAVTAETLARDALGRVAARDVALHAFVLVTEDRALADARRADDELKSGRDRGPFGRSDARRTRRQHPKLRQCHRDHQ